MPESVQKGTRGTFAAVLGDPSVHLRSPLKPQMTPELTERIEFGTLEVKRRQKCPPETITERVLEFDRQQIETCVFCRGQKPAKVV